MTLRLVPCLVLGCSFWILVSCGGSSSETPPPLEPLPANLHYNRSATALSGDQPLPQRDAGVTPEPESPKPPDGAAPAPPSRADEGDEPATE